MRQILPTAILLVIAAPIAACCSTDTTFFGRIQQANDAQLAAALDARKLVVVPLLSAPGAAELDASGVARLDTGGGDGVHPVFVAARSDASAGPPNVTVVRDGGGTLHVVHVKPKKQSTESHTVCGCGSGGGAPPPAVTWYVPLTGSQGAGAPFDVEIDELISATVRYTGASDPSCMRP
ncbi:hypothetical protein BH09MYX1_BH09MYX1_46820 [soil metagenome]